MTSKYSLYQKHSSFENAILFYCFISIFRTSGPELACTIRNKIRKKAVVRG
jgi:hypothetical protein